VKLLTHLPVTGETVVLAVVIGFCLVVCVLGFSVVGLAVVLVVDCDTGLFAVDGASDGAFVVGVGTCWVVKFRVVGAEVIGTVVRGPGAVVEFCPGNSVDVFEVIGTCWVVFVALFGWD